MNLSQQVSVLSNRRCSVVVDTISVGATMIRVEIDSAHFSRGSDDELVDAIVGFSEKEVRSGGIACDVDAVLGKPDVRGASCPELFADFESDTDFVRRFQDAIAEQNCLLENETISLDLSSLRSDEGAFGYDGGASGSDGGAFWV